MLRTLRDLVGLAATALGVTALVAIATQPPQAPVVHAQPAAGTPLQFPAWNFDCAPLAKGNLTYEPYSLTFTSEWVVPSKNPSAGYLRVSGVGERNSTAVVRITTAKDQLDWQKVVREKPLDPAGDEAVALANAAGSFSLKDINDTGKVEFRFPWAMFPPKGEQLSIDVRGCKSTTNRDGGSTFMQTTLPNAAVTISNIDQKVVSVCTTCATTNMLDCEHVTQTAVVLDDPNKEVLFGDEERPLDPINAGGKPLLVGPDARASKFDWLAKLKDPAKGPFDPSNLAKFDRDPSRATLNSGTPDGMGTMPYFLGSGLKQYIDANEDSSFQMAGAEYTAKFAAFFAVKEHQTQQVRAGARGYVIQPAAYLDFSADVRLGCISYGFCGVADGSGNVTLSVDNPGAMGEPLQLLLFVPKVDGDRNGDALVNDLDELPDTCTDTPEKCKFTVKGKLSGINPESVTLFAGGSNPAYKTQDVQLNGGVYTFTNVLPGRWVVKVDKDAEGHPCHITKEVLVATDGTTWKLTDPATPVSVEDLDGSDQCFLGR